jgi:hypothetical protein
MEVIELIAFQLDAQFRFGKLGTTSPGRIVIKKFTAAATGSA